MSICPSILLVDDEKNTREGLRQFLEGQDYDVLTACDGAQGWRLYVKERPDVVISDIRMPEIDGLSLLAKIQKENRKTAVILLTAYGSVEDAVKAMKNGAFYYLTKPVNLDELNFLLKKALNSQQLEEENRELREQLFTQKFEKGEILAKSKKMAEVLKTIEQIAKTNSTVLIEGESGTGKELAAHRIHNLSNRASRSFVAVHCAALTSTLLTSELFGHERGAFTGASERKIGRFERADQGTLFLDEIGEISQDAQVKLLRVLQDGEFERVGGTKTIKANVRLICATNKNLLEEVKARRFREDLYYRINVIFLTMPTLRERKEDIALLAEHYMHYFAQINNKQIKGFTSEAMGALSRYQWPGNIRELKNIVERIVVLSHDEMLDAQNLPSDIRGSQMSSPKVAKQNGSESLSDLERDHIEQTLRELHGNKSLAAKQLGISRRTLYRKISQYRL